MMIDLLVQKKILNKEQANYLKENKLIIKKKERYTFSNVDFKNILDTVADKIIDTFTFNLNIEASLYDKLINSKKEETQKALVNSKESISYLLETLLETVTDYIPTFKKEWSGAVLNKKTMNAMRKRKLLEIVYDMNGNAMLCDCNLFLNKKTADAVCFELNGGKNTGRYKVVERGIK